jgi:plastocyanin
MTQLKTMAAAAALMMAAAACAAAPANTTPQVVEVRASDFAFQAPDTVAPGLTTFRLASTGKEMHHVQVVRLENGHTAKELVDVLAATKTFPAWATLQGGAQVPAPGTHMEATATLEPGSYALLCMIPSPDGVPHVMKGMWRDVVVAGETRQALTPRADVRVVLKDYAFEMTPEISAGRRTLRVEVDAPQAHEVVIARLAPGRTAMELAQWAEKQEGPPPAQIVGGVSGLQPGQHNFITADFTPGEYALVCFWPDHRDGLPHVAHGMVKQITVR